MKDEIQEIINSEVQALQNLVVNENFEQAVTLIEEQVHQKGGKVVISGMGKAGQIGVNIATTLASTGTPAVFLHPSESQHGDLGIVQKNDILFLISNSGKTREIVELETLVKRLFPEIKIIGLTGNLEGDLAQFSDVSLYHRCSKRSVSAGTCAYHFYYCNDCNWRYNYCALDEENWFYNRTICA